MKDSEAPATLGDLPSLGPGMVTIVLRTPLGVYFLDPFAPPDPTVDRIIKLLGIDVELRLGPPSQEDMDAPRLSTGLLAVGGLLGFLAWRAWSNRKLL